MTRTYINSEKPASFLPNDFNKKKFAVSYSPVSNPYLKDIQNSARKTCLGKIEWPQIDTISTWMVTAETATFMKWGGLGMVASELAESFNCCFGKDGHSCTIVTPLYLGNTGKKKTSFENDVYFGAENKQIPLQKICRLSVPFMNEHQKLVGHNTDVFCGNFNGVDYIFLSNNRFFSINPHKDNPPAQDGCYVLNEFNINEVERFAFFSKAVYCLLEKICKRGIKGLKKPNSVIANDWHSGALSGLTKYFTVAKLMQNQIEKPLADELHNMPIIHIAHHLGYQGWDYENTAKILNSLYEDLASVVFKNAKTTKNNNPRTQNTLIVHDCYNQASCNFNLADRVVTVSKNYLEETSKEKCFGYDFRDILKIRKDHRNFFGIVNGYEKNLISPNKDKINHLNEYFKDFDFRVFDDNSLYNKLHNKQEFIRLLSKLASDEKYKEHTIPLVDIYKFDDIFGSIKNFKKTPIICATSRLVEQKGYDIATQAIINLIKDHADLHKEYPIVVMGGAGNKQCFETLRRLKDSVALSYPEIAKRIFVFCGYKDEFAYAIQLASDFYMMPSKFEPCGLTQMEAMAKGALPIAMSTGGLVDTIDDGIDGFRTKVFFTDNNTKVYGDNRSAKRLENNTNAYAETIWRALCLFYSKPQKLKVMTQNAMRKDFGWKIEKGSIYKYFNLLKTGHL